MPKQLSPKQIISDHYRQLSQKANAARTQKLSPERRREIAVNAARIKWQRYREQKEREAVLKLKQEGQQSS